MAKETTTSSMSKIQFNVFICTKKRIILLAVPYECQSVLSMRDSSFFSFSHLNWWAHVIQCPRNRTHRAHIEDD